MISVKALVSARSSRSGRVTLKISRKAEINLRAETRQHSGRGRGSRNRKAEQKAGRKKQAKRLR